MMRRRKRKKKKYEWKNECERNCEQLLPFQTIVSFFILLHFHIQNNNNYYSYWYIGHDEIGGWQMAKEGIITKFKIKTLFQLSVIRSVEHLQPSIHFIHVWKNALGKLFRKFYNSSSSFTFCYCFIFGSESHLKAQIVIRACNWNQSWRKKKADIISDVNLLSSPHLIFAHFFFLHSPFANFFIGICPSPPSFVPCNAYDGYVIGF